MAIKIVKRGYVLVHNRPAYRKVNAGPGLSAVLASREEAERLQKRFGGTIVSAVGLKYKMAQGTLRVLSDPTERAAVIAAAKEKKS